MSECGVSICGCPIQARNTALAHSCLTTKSNGPKVKPLQWVKAENWNLETYGEFKWEEAEKVVYLKN